MQKKTFLEYIFKSEYSLKKKLLSDSLKECFIELQQT